MAESKFISLSAKDISSFRYMREAFDKKSFSRFKSLVEGACTPVHLSDEAKTERETSVLIGPAVGYPPPYLELPQEVYVRAAVVAREENAKIGGGWIDGDKLAVSSALYFRSTLSMLVKRMKYSQIVAMKGDSFEEIASRGAFKLDTNTHVIATEGGRELLVVGARGRSTGEPKMGAETFLAPAEGDMQWSLATNGMIEAEMVSSGKEAEAWMKSSLRELGPIGYRQQQSMRYLGLIVDQHTLRGAVGIVGELRTKLSPQEIEEGRRNTRHSVEVPKLDAVPLDVDALASYLRANRGSMTPQLISSLVILGHDRWGNAFLEKADK
jgi:hypothetical protein